MKPIQFRKFSFAAKGIGLLVFVIATFILIRSEDAFPEKTLCALGIAAVFLFFLSLTWRPGLAALLAGALLLVIVRVQQFKSGLMLQPFLITDVVFFFTRLSANLIILLSYKALATRIAIAGCVMAIAGPLFCKFERPLISSRKSGALALRLLTLLVAVLIIPAALVAIKFSDLDALSTLKHPHALIVGSAPHNILSTLILSHRMADIKIPDRNSSDLKEDRLLFENVAAAASASKNPDIILWHNESTFDPKMLAACDVPECSFNLFKPDPYTVANDLLKVHCFGGASWTSEFAILTGLNHEIFGEGGLYTHFTLAPRIRYALPSILKEQGYRTIALYPDPKQFFNAYEAYRDYGFEEFYAPEDMGLPNDPALITDRVMYEKMAEILGPEHTRPIFIYVLTQFQHGPHNTPVEALPEPYKSLRIPGLSGEENLNLVNYLYRLSLTDSVMTDLEETFIKAPGARPTLFLQYGDHQPSFDGLMLGMRKRGLDAFPDSTHHLFTRFSLKANFPTLKESHEYLDISFLASLILDAAAVRKDKYFTANARLRRLCDGKYLDCADKDLLNKYHDYLFYELDTIRQ